MKIYSKKTKETDRIASHSELDLSNDRTALLISHYSTLGLFELVDAK
jgi:hypothetical protein